MFGYDDPILALLAKFNVVPDGKIAFFLNVSVILTVINKTKLRNFYLLLSNRKMILSMVNTLYLMEPMTLTK